MRLFIISANKSGFKFLLQPLTELKFWASLPADQNEICPRTKCFGSPSAAAVLIYGFCDVMQGNHL